MYMTMLTNLDVKLQTSYPTCDLEMLEISPVEQNKMSECPRVCSSSPSPSDLLRSTCSTEYFVSTDIRPPCESACRMNSNDVDHVSASPMIERYPGSLTHSTDHCMDGDTVEELVQRRIELRRRLSRLNDQLLKLLYEEWTLTGHIPEGYEDLLKEMNKRTQPVKTTSYPLPRMLIRRASTLTRPLRDFSDLSTSSQLSGSVPWSGDSGHDDRDFTTPSKLCDETAPTFKVPTTFRHGKRNPECPSEQIDCPASAASTLSGDRALSVLPSFSPNDSHTVLNIFSSNHGEDLDSEQDALVEEGSWTEDEEDIRRTAYELQLRRLEIDYAVISQLHAVHKQRAIETKREAYRIAYKSNSRKLKEISAQMSEIRVRLQGESKEETQTKQRGPKATWQRRKTWNPLRFPATQWAVSTLPRRQSRLDSPDSARLRPLDAYSTPVTPDRRFKLTFDSPQKPPPSLASGTTSPSMSRASSLASHEQSREDTMNKRRPKRTHQHRASLLPLIQLFRHSESVDPLRDSAIDLPDLNYDIRRGCSSSHTAHISHWHSAPDLPTALSTSRVACCRRGNHICPSQKKECQWMNRVHTSSGLDHYHPNRSDPTKLTDSGGSFAVSLSSFAPIGCRSSVANQNSGTINNVDLALRPAASHASSASNWSTSGCSCLSSQTNNSSNEASERQLPLSYHMCTNALPKEMSEHPRKLEDAVEPVVRLRSIEDRGRRVRELSSAGNINAYRSAIPVKCICSCLSEHITSVTILNSRTSSQNGLIDPTPVGSVERLVRSGLHYPRKHCIHSTDSCETTVPASPVRTTSSSPSSSTLDVSRLTCAEKAKSRTTCVFQTVADGGDKITGLQKGSSSRRSIRPLALLRRAVSKVTKTPAPECNLSGSNPGDTKPVDGPVIIPALMTGRQLCNWMENTKASTACPPASSLNNTNASLFTSAPCSPTLSSSQVSGKSKFVWPSKFRHSTRCAR
ncbi:unnamed protein product [Echinostoma caproni]|uniref:PEHE domain-containing protein n=1 Tax=Echinostoma caproni TaxID=27848 RepID=A0A182ZZI4_9TREM|nr:unnamed protein product [Echinostoma caproni]